MGGETLEIGGEILEIEIGGEILEIEMGGAILWLRQLVLIGLG